MTAQVSCGSVMNHICISFLLVDCFVMSGNTEVAEGIAPSKQNIYSIKVCIQLIENKHPFPANQLQLSWIHTFFVAWAIVCESSMRFTRQTKDQARQVFLIAPPSFIVCDFILKPAIHVSHSCNSFVYQNIYSSDCDQKMRLITRVFDLQLLMLVQNSDSFMEMMRWGKESPESVID